MTGMTGSKGEERLLRLLAIQRMGRLRPSEKRAVLALLDDGLPLSVLSTGHVEAATGRRFRAPLPDYRGAALHAAAEADLRLLRSIDARFVSEEDASYPAALRELADPPFGLYLRGPDLPGDRPAIAMVGTRHPTGHGLESARRLSRGFARAGLAVISGLAIGIDQAAHRGALSGGGLTCAVLPCGIEAVYPACHRSLAGAILEAGGLLVSEYPPGTPIGKRAFPERNRIVSGLARGTLVVEAPAESGALITADFALDEGRDVFIAADRVGGPRSAGLDRLLADGATPVFAAEDVLDEWRIAFLAPERYGAEPRQGAEGGTRKGERPSTDEGLALACALRAELRLGQVSLYAGN